MILLAMFDSGDTILIILFIIIFGGGFAATRSKWGAAQTERLQRMEDKLNMIMHHFGLNYVPSNMAKWQRIAPKNKDKAIKEYEEEHGVGEDEAKVVVEQYLDDQQRPLI